MTVREMRLERSLAAWGTPDFERSLKQELESLDRGKLPLQQGLAHGSHVADTPFTVVLLGALELEEAIRVRAGIFYSAILGGCSCADDPTPAGELAEYCEVQLDIDLETSETSVFLIE